MPCSVPPGWGTSGVISPTRGLAVHNVDLTIVAQRPKLAVYIPAMVQVLAAELSCPEARVNVKATTTERMGFTGRGEGIAAFAVALLRELVEWTEPS
jgi:2-C-methyl-D-erythritol 2,4-cyclodiphosphate synthase